MRCIKLFSCLLLLLIQANAQQPTIKILESGKKVSIRGLSVVNDNVIWASGSNGSVARSVDGGTTWTWQTIPGYEKMDFRDIEAFDENTAIIMGITEPGVLFKTNDGGKNWKKVFEDTSKGVFLDAIDFINDKHGYVIGDPISDHKAYGIVTDDGGNTWKKINNNSSYGPLHDGESFFAASGTNIRFRKERGMVAVTGGTRSRLFTSYTKSDPLPIIQGLKSTGAFSIDVLNGKSVIVGGDFEKDTISTDNCVLVSFQKNGVKMYKPQTPPHGHRSCVIYLDEKNLLTCGPSGIDISKDGGMNWQLIGKESFHVCQKAKKGKAVFLAGKNGRIAKLIYL